MSERRGLWSLLSSAWAYEAFHHLIGARRWLRRFALETVCARPGDRVLDIGCGPGALLRYLPHATYIGFDRSTAYIERAKSEYGGRGTFICDEVRNFARHALPPVDIAVAIGILHHLDDETAERLFRDISATLRPGGRLITADPCFHPEQSMLQRLVVSNDRGMHVRPFERYVELARSVFPQARAEFQRGHVPFPYSICVTRTTTGMPT